MIERQLGRVLLVAAILTPVFVADVHSQTLHTSCLAAASNVDVSVTADHGWNGIFFAWRSEHAIAVPLFYVDSILENHDDRSRYADRPERLIGLVEK
jgi:hypothetical protein